MEDVFNPRHFGCNHDAHEMDDMERIRPVRLICKNSQLGSYAQRWVVNWFIDPRKLAECDVMIFKSIFIL